MSLSLSVSLTLQLAPGAQRQLLAAPELLVIKSTDKQPAPRWMFGQGEVPKASGAKSKGVDPTVALLASVKAAQFNGDWGKCLAQIGKSRSKAKSLEAWLAVVEIECALKVKTTVSSTNRLVQVLNRVDKNPSWLLKGAHVSVLRPLVISGYLAAIEQDVKTNRSRAWKSIDSLREMIGYMDTKERASLWQLAGELAFVQQKNEASLDFFRRSLNETDSAEVRQRVASLEVTQGAASSGAKATTISPSQRSSPQISSSAASGASVGVVETSPEELALIEQVTAALKAGELIRAIEDAIKIIKNYPGSTNVKWASDRVLDVYGNVSGKTNSSDAKFIHLRQKVFTSLLSADADRLVEWARFMFSRGYYVDCHELVKKALPGLSGSRLTAALDLGAKAALASDDFVSSKQMSADLILKHSGTAASREAMVRSGIINYRTGQYVQAASDFEKVTALSQYENLELISRYWLWRSLQKTKSDRANVVADELMLRFPFSYYGLRARMERTGNVLEWKNNEAHAKATSQLWLTPFEKAAWSRFQLLLNAGWLDEAQAELRELPAPLLAEDKAVRALLHSASGQHLRASQLANQAWDEKSDFRSAPYVSAAFPKEFSNWIEEHTKARKLEAHLIRGLIKQESGFESKAVSRSNALGLMQMIPPTAREIAVDLKLGSVVFPQDMFEPHRNIQMGTYYFSRLLTKYQGHVPLALAAYNAGQGRVDRWLHSRVSLKDLAKLNTSQPDNELWFDEFPYSETSFYIKAILRNVLIYRMLDQGRVENRDPLWSS